MTDSVRGLKTNNVYSSVYIRDGVKGWFTRYQLELKRATHGDNIGTKIIFFPFNSKEFYGRMTLN